MPEAMAIFSESLALRGLSVETLRGYSIDSRQFTKWLVAKVTEPVLVTTTVV